LPFWVLERAVLGHGLGIFNLKMLNKVPKFLLNLSDFQKKEFPAQKKTTKHAPTNHQCPY